MQLHRNAKLGLRGRRELVRAIERGTSLKAAAAAFSVSPATAHRWWHRWQAADATQRDSLVCLFDRSSRPSELRADALARRAGSDLRGQAPLRLGTAIDCRRDRSFARD